MSASWLIIFKKDQSDLIAERKAADLIMDLADNLHCLPLTHIRKKPGEFFLSLPKEKQEILKSLKSKDLEKVRINHV